MSGVRCTTEDDLYCSHCESDFSSQDDFRLHLAACRGPLPSKQGAALEELVRTATEVHRISHRTHEAWTALAAALNEARAVMTQPDETPAPTSNELVSIPVGEHLWLLKRIKTLEAKIRKMQKKLKPSNAPETPEACNCRPDINGIHHVRCSSRNAIPRDGDV